MKRRYLLFIATLLLIELIKATDAQSNPTSSIGTAIIVKGTVRINTNTDTHNLTQGEKIPPNAILSTGSNSALKVLLIDQSSIILGSDSTMKTDEMTQKNSGSVNLIQGQLRSKVMKNILAAQSHPIKFIVKTRSAVMGVRGTDFEVIYNPQNNITSLVTFEGAVAMIKNDQNTAEQMARLSDAKTVVVTPGNFSTVNPTLPEVTQPVKISPAQFESMKQADPTSNHPLNNPATNATQPTSHRTFMSIVPPGVDAKAVASNPISANNPASTTTVTTNSTVQTATQNLGPPPGGYIDAKTGLYIPPPPGSAYDPQQKIYIPPATMGKFDWNTGNYVPPAGNQLNPVQGFVLNTQQANGQNVSSNTNSNGANSSTDAGTNGRSPASQNLVPYVPVSVASVGMSSMVVPNFPAFIPPPGFKAPGYAPPPNIPGISLPASLTPLSSNSGTGGIDPNCPSCPPPTTTINPGTSSSTNSGFYFNVH